MSEEESTYSPLQRGYLQELLSYRLHELPGMSTGLPFLGPGAYGPDNYSLVLVDIEGPPTGPALLHAPVTIACYATLASDKSKEPCEWRAIHDPNLLAAVYVAAGHSDDRLRMLADELALFVDAMSSRAWKCMADYRWSELRFGLERTAFLQDVSAACDVTIRGCGRVIDAIALGVLEQYSAHADRSPTIEDVRRRMEIRRERQAPGSGDWSGKALESIARLSSRMSMIRPADLYCLEGPIARVLLWPWLEFEQRATQDMTVRLGDLAGRAVREVSRAVDRAAPGMSPVVRVQIENDVVSAVLSIDTALAVKEAAQVAVAVEHGSEGGRDG